MIFLAAIELLIANTDSFDKAIPESIGSKAPLEQLELLPNSQDNQNSLDPVLPGELMLEIKPFVLEGSVEKFDPVLRAAELAKNMNRKFCGTYKSFDKESSTDVTFTIAHLKPIGQTVDLYGEMNFGGIIIPIYGNLNAKSDQVELIPLGEKLISDLESGGRFVGLEGIKLFSWKSPRMNNSGGRLELLKKCDETLSKAPSIRTIW